MKLSGIPLTIKVGLYYAFYYVGVTLVYENDKICDFAAQQQSAVRVRVFGSPNAYKSTKPSMRVSKQLKRLETSLASCDPCTEEALALQEEIAAVKRKGFIAIISNKIF